MSTTMNTGLNSCEQLPAISSPETLVLRIFEPAMSSQVNQNDQQHDSSSKSEEKLKLRRYKWDSYFTELVAVYAVHQIYPTSGSHGTKLDGWVKRQRCHYRRFQKGHPSAMTQERIEQLESIGFIWDRQENLWQQRFAQLSDFKKAHGNCYVPTHFCNNPKLGIWVKCQRRQHKLHNNGHSSNVTKERTQQLNDIGFQWDGEKTFATWTQENKNQVQLV